MKDLAHKLIEAEEQVGEILNRLLPSQNTLASRLYEGMRYASLEGGKRLRPFLVIQCSELFNVERSSALRTAAAVELVHCYSLVHDDLPSMDDDDLRRGKPSTHRQFDEATAVLVGDALLTLAFEILAHPETHKNARIRCNLVLELARASGANGMVAGQMMDLTAKKEKFDISDITCMQFLKTGALITFACKSAAILSNAKKSEHEALRDYAYNLGLAFQIKDDLLDLEGTEEELGKAVAKDDLADKVTFVELLGPEQAHSRARQLVKRAIKNLSLFGKEADNLRAIAQFILERRS